MLVLMKLLFVEHLSKGRRPYLAPWVRYSFKPLQGFCIFTNLAKPATRRNQAGLATWGNKPIPQVSTQRTQTPPRTDGVPVLRSCLSYQVRAFADWCASHSSVTMASEGRSLRYWLQQGWVQGVTYHGLFPASPAELDTEPGWGVLLRETFFDNKRNPRP